MSKCLTHRVSVLLIPVPRVFRYEWRCFISPLIDFRHLCCRSLFSTKPSGFRPLVCVIHLRSLFYVLIVCPVIINVEVKFLPSYSYSAIHRYFRSGTRQYSEFWCSGILLHFATLPCPSKRRSTWLQLGQRYGIYGAIYLLFTTI